MIIGCILCGGIVEVTLVMMGLSAVIGWFKNRHKKDKCSCCKGKEHKKDPLANSRPMTPAERKSINSFFWSHFKKGKNE
jgi:hypothetical protein